MTTPRNPAAAIPAAAAAISTTLAKGGSCEEAATAALEAAAPYAGDISAAQLVILMTTPGVIDAYHGWMHGFHGLRTEGCDCCDHASEIYQAGFRLGVDDPGKPERDEAERRWREWKPDPDQSAFGANPGDSLSIDEVARADGDT
jgi:hypothetical protein